MSFGDNLKIWMDRKGLNAYELSEISNVPVQTIYSMIKRNSKRADVEYIIRIAKALGVTVDELLGSEGRDIHYLNPESARVAQELLDNPDLRLLFDVARDASPDDLRLTAETLTRLKRAERPLPEDFSDEVYPDEFDQSPPEDD